MNTRTERLAAAAVALLLLACALLLATRGRIDSDLQGFMPSGDRLLPPEVASLAFDGPGDRLILGAVAGGTAADRIAASKALAAALADVSAIARVVNGLNPELADAIADLREYRYLLSPTVSEQHFSIEHLREALAARLRELASPLGNVDAQGLRADPTGVFRSLLRRAAGQGGARRVDGVWVSGDGERSPLLIELTDTGLDMDAKADVIEAIRNRFEHVRGDADLQLALSGGPVFAVYSRDLIRAEVQRLSIAATVLMVLILGWSYRSARALLLMGLPLAGAVLTGTAAVVLVFGSIHGIAFAFGVTLVGVAVDYPVHVFSHRRAGESSAVCVARIWPTLRLGVLTTLLGYLAMLFTEITGLAQLGTFAIGGLLGAALITRYLLSGLIPVHMPTPRTGKRPPLLSATPPAAGATLLLAAAVLAGLGLWTQRENLWASDLQAMSPIPPALATVDEGLRADLGVPDLRYMALIRGDSAQQVLERSEGLADALEPLRERGVLEAVDHPAALLPSVATQSARQALLPPSTELTARVRAVADEVGFREGVFDAFIADVEASRSLPPLTPEDIRQRGLGLLLEDRLFARNNQWFGLVRFQGVDDPLALAEWFADQAPTAVVYVDSKRRIEAALADFRDKALERFALGALLILLTLVVGLRTLGGALRVATPALLAAAVAAALLVVSGQHLSVFHLVSLLLVVGLGLDYALFFNRRAADAADHEQTFRALAICVISTLCVFGLLASSQLAVLGEIGTTVSIGTLAALVFAWLSSRRQQPA